jgi:hypothetical protein
MRYQERLNHHLLVTRFRTTLLRVKTNPWKNIFRAQAQTHTLTKHALRLVCEGTTSTAPVRLTHSAPRSAICSVPTDHMKLPLGVLRNYVQVNAFWFAFYQRVARTICNSCYLFSLNSPPIYACLRERRRHNSQFSITRIHFASLLLLMYC